MLGRPAAPILNSEFGKLFVSDKRLFPLEIPNDDVSPCETFHETSHRSVRRVSRKGPWSRQRNDFSHVNRVTKSQRHHVAKCLTDVERRYNTCKHNSESE